jgi:hypothetical protein
MAEKVINPEYIGQDPAEGILNNGASGTGLPTINFGNTFKSPAFWVIVGFALGIYAAIKIKKL